MLKRVLQVLILAVVPLFSVAQATVFEYELKNGLRLLVQPDHRSPIVVSQLWYRVGSSYEYSGITGVSHVLEHMMFKGTPRFPDGQFSEIIADLGGRENAFTSRDYTAYYQVLGKEHLETALILESDRVRNLRMHKDDFLKELEVVKEERRLRTDDKPTSLLYEQLMATAFDNSPYHNPVIGWVADLDSMQLADLEAWYASYYAPNNATLVVVGDVDPDAVYRLVNRHYGRIKSDTVQEPKPRKEREQRGQRYVTVKAPAEVPYLIMGYKTPVLKTLDATWEAYALEVLAGILDGGESARLSKNMVRGAEVAASAGAGYSAFSRLDRLFLLDATPAETADIATVKKALLAEVADLQKHLVAPAELERVKAQVVASEIYQRDSIEHLANQLGVVSSLGMPWQILDEYADNIRAVTAEQIRTVAQKYLVSERLTIAELIPEKIQ